MSMELAQNLDQQVANWPPLGQVGAGVSLVLVAVVLYWLGDRDEESDAGCFLWALALLLGIAGISIVARAL